jgi:hypothetical protein
MLHKIQMGKRPRISENNVVQSNWNAYCGMLIDWLIDWLRFYIPLKNFSLIWTLSFSGLIRRTAPFSHLLRHTRGCGESILTWILTGYACFRQQDEVQQFNVHPSTINRLLSCFREIRQVSACWRRRRQLKTAVHRNRCIFRKSRCNPFVPASKIANELHPTSGVRISDQRKKPSFLRMSIYACEDLMLRYIWLIVIVTRMLPGQPLVYTGLSSNAMQFNLLMSFVFMCILKIYVLVFGIQNSKVNNV